MAEDEKPEEGPTEKGPPKVIARKWDPIIDYDRHRDPISFCDFREQHARKSDDGLS